MKMSGIKLEEKRNMKEKCETKVKQEPKSVIMKKEANEVKASTASCISLGAKSKLTELPKAKDQQKLGPYQFTTRLFNSEVNLISDWVVEHKPQMVSNKRYKHRTKKTLIFVFQEYPKFDLAGDTVQVKDGISPMKIGARMEPLDGARFLSL
jgi:hypothetical protein